MITLDIVILLLVIALPIYIIPELLIRLNWVKRTKSKET